MLPLLLVISAALASYSAQQAPSSLAATSESITNQQPPIQITQTVNGSTSASLNAFRQNPAWLTPEQHQAAAALAEHLEAKFDFHGGPVGITPLRRGPEWLAGDQHVQIAPWSEPDSELGQLWDWSRMVALAGNTKASVTFAQIARNRAVGGRGFWTADSDGRVTAHDGAPYFGSVTGNSLNGAVVSLACRPQGDGYWLATSDGEVFAFGKAALHGSLADHPINQPVTGICATKDGDGYWLVASDGGVFSFGAPFKGSMGGAGADNFVGMAAAPNNGYWLLRADGEVFAFDAPFLGSMSGQGFSDFASIVAKADGSGYWLVRKNGVIYSFRVGRKDGFDPTLQLMTTLLRKPAPLTEAPDLVPQYHGRAWHVDDGLPHDTVKALAQSRDGYIWVGTAEGLARFDGIRFAPQNLDVIAWGSRSINVLCPTASGLWVGAESGGLACWNGSFQRMYRSASFPDDRVRSLLGASDGSVWIGTASGLSHFKNGHFTRYSRAEGLLSDVVLSLAEGRSGRIWIGTANGLNCFSDNAITTPFSTTNVPPREAIRAVHVDRVGSLWAGLNTGLMRFENGQWTRLTKEDGLNDNYISAIFEDRMGQLWIGTAGGLNRIRGRQILSQASDFGGFYDWVHAITEDREGNIWVGTKNGLRQLSFQRFTTYTRQQGLSHNSVMSVCEDPRGSCGLAPGAAACHAGKTDAFLPWPNRAAWPTTRCWGCSRPTTARSGWEWTSAAGFSI